MRQTGRIRKKIKKTNPKKKNQKSGRKNESEMRCEKGQKKKV